MLIALKETARRYIAPALYSEAIVGRVAVLDVNRACMYLIVRRATEQQKPTSGIKDARWLH